MLLSDGAEQEDRVQSEEIGVSEDRVQLSGRPLTKLHGLVPINRGECFEVNLELR